MSKTLQLSHIVFGTRGRVKSIAPEHAEELYRLIWSMLNDRRCKLYRINGMPDHVHMLVDIHPEISLATLMEQVKSKSSQWMKKSGFFPLFEGWGREYFAESKGIIEKDKIIEYIKGQQRHHTTTPYIDEMRQLYREMRQLYRENGIEWHDDELS